MAAELDIATWLEIGRTRGWVSDVVCSSHDGLPTTDAEDEAFEEGGDPCLPAVRLWLDNA